MWLGFHKMLGVFGLWLGFSIACIVLDLGFLMIIECPSWSKISQKIQKQIDKEKLLKINNSVKAGKRLTDNEYAGQTASTEPAKTFQRLHSIDQATPKLNKKTTN